MYRARDSRLKREVAIKVLPDEFCRDVERVSRFQREAEVLASLNHANIAAIHDLQEANGSRFLILELVEGETLADRIALGPIPLEESLAIAKQIVEALEAAHEKGVVHRDLKPANVKVLPDGKVKVLDFGLAKALEGSAANASLSHSPTISMANTNAGVILGTAAYMSPEQAKGKPADTRSDNWAFGVVLYEMLTGRLAFDGETAVEILGGVLKTDPDWTALPATTPASVLSLLRHCLQKDRNRRLHHIGDARFQIDEALQQPAGTAAVPATFRKNREWMWIAAALVGLIAAVGVTMWHFTSLPADALETRLQIVTPPATSLTSFAISPDGRKVVFEGTNTGKDQLWLRRLESETAQALSGTESAQQPFWSPDSRSVGFFADGKLKRIDIAGGAPQTLADAPISPGGAWSSEGTILFALNATGPLQRVSATGGPVMPLTSVDPPQQVSHRFPLFLPDGQHFLFFAAGTPDGRGVYIGSLDDKQTKRLFDADSAASFAPPDQLLFVRQGTLFAQRLDLRKAEMVGDPVPVAGSVPYNMNWLAEPAFSVSETGNLAYRSGTRERELIWLDRAGRQVGVIGKPDDSQPSGLRPSPDGRTVALDRSVNGNVDVWLIDAARGVLRRLTQDPADDGTPVWSPDGSHISYRSRQKKGNLNLYRRPVSGTGSDETLVESPENKFPLDWSPDGRFLLYRSESSKTGIDLWVLSSDERKSFPLAQSSADEDAGRFSPDGHWIAFQSNETGRYEIYVQPFPGPAGKSSPISTNGGTAPQWRGDGKEIFYMGLDNRLMAVPITLRPNGQTDAGAPVPLFSNRPASEYSALPDGQRFLLNTLTADASTSPITLVLNWTATLKKK